MLELININKNYNPGSVNELCLFKDFNSYCPLASLDIFIIEGIDKDLLAFGRIIEGSPSRLIKGIPR